LASVLVGGTEQLRIADLQLSIEKIRGKKKLKIEKGPTQKWVGFFYWGEHGWVH